MSTGPRTHRWVGMFGPMSLVRFVARSLVAGVFIVDGVKKVTHPDDVAEDAEQFTSSVTPLIQRVAPAGYSSWVPEDARTWVRGAGVAQIAGGAMFALGIGRRLGALVLAGTSVLNVAIALPGKDASKAQKEAARPELLTHLALLGSTVLAAQDLQGRPSLSWRAGHTIESADKKISSATDKLSRKATKAAKKATKDAKLARKQVGKKLGSVIS